MKAEWLEGDAHETGMPAKGCDLCRAQSLHSSDEVRETGRSEGRQEGGYVKDIQKEGDRRK